MTKLTPNTKPNACQQDLIDRKYGMFIHYGLNTFLGTQWSDGKCDATVYAPYKIDVDSWIRNAYEVGMNYVIIITKHHDGFCMWDTDSTDYSINSTRNHTDVVMEASKACKKYGLKLGLYYSLWDRHEKCYSDDKAYTDYMIGHLRELCGGKYGDICEVWLDGGWEKSNDAWNIPLIYDTIKELQPNAAITTNITIGEFNDVGFPSKKYQPKKYKENMPMRYFPSDFRLFDPFMTKVDDPKIYTHDGKQYYLPFESTVAIRDMRIWFSEPKYTRTKLLSKKFIVNRYRVLTSQQNALVVNVGPNKYGVMESSDINRLREVADELGIRRQI